jgi:fluoride exporter
VSLPRDRDVEPTDSAPTRSGESPFEVRPTRRGPHLRGDVLVAIFVGGCLGGLARYAIVKARPVAADRFPWPTLAINVSGAFVLALLIVVAAQLVSSRYLRPLLGTGFCGAFTTFSAIVVTDDEFFAQHHPGLAVGYLAASIVGGLAAASLGLVIGRAVAVNRRRVSEQRSDERTRE